MKGALPSCHFDTNTKTKEPKPVIKARISGVAAESASQDLPPSASVSNTKAILASPRFEKKNI